MNGFRLFVFLGAALQTTRGALAFNEKDSTCIFCEIFLFWRLRLWKWV